MVLIGSRFENVERVRLLEDQLFTLDAKGWLENEFLTWEWWLLLAFFVVPWILWSIMKKRKWLLESVLFGVMVMLVTILLDIIGLQFSFWEYPVEFLPIIPRAFPFDISIVPVAFMLIFQYNRSWKSFMIAQLIMAMTYAFIGEPICEWIDLVHYIKWNYLYSFFYYIVLGVAVRALILKCASVSKPYPQ